ncbi:MAG: GGDEF domain-containing protein [Candidatus Theseobacter exili]|nr:GGDEF domain-containing protein [Candidatus Theseobacter exili]
MNQGEVDNNSNDKEGFKTIFVKKKKKDCKKKKAACIVLIYGKPLGKVYSLENDDITIGRGEDSDIVIDDPAISRIHATIHMDDENVAIIDQQSSNGTYVNDQKEKHIQLHDGDLIALGQSILKFIVHDDIENAYHDAIFQMASKDGLTGVYTNRHFMEIMKMSVSRSKRHQRSLSVLMLDLDLFKNINDTYGHQAGDYVLKETASIVIKNLREEDLFARYGGEEFILLLPDTILNNAILVAEKIRRIIDLNQYIYNGKEMEVTVSIGVASLEQKDNSSKLIERADKALYLAKNNGRNRCECER